MVHGMNSTIVPCTGTTYVDYKILLAGLRVAFIIRPLRHRPSQVRCSRIDFSCGLECLHLRPLSSSFSSAAAVLLHEVSNVRPRLHRAARRTYLRKPPFLSNLYKKTIILARQARDKHRETRAPAAHRACNAGLQQNNGRRFVG